MPTSGPPPSAVLFACNQNVIRSPMAAGLMRRRFGPLSYVASCGVRSGGAPDPFAVTVMDEIGVDLSKHRPKTFAELDDLAFDLIVTLTPEAHHRALEAVRLLPIDVEYWPTADPSWAQGSRDQRLEEYRAVRDALDAQIARRFVRAAPG